MTQDKRENLTSYVTKDEKRDVKLAMAYAGIDTLSDFVRDATLEKARQIIEKEKNKDKKAS